MISAELRAGWLSSLSTSLSRGGFIARAPGLVGLVAVLWVAYLLAQLTWSLMPRPDLPTIVAVKAKSVSGRKNTTGSQISRIPEWHLFGYTRTVAPAPSKTTQAPKTRLNLRLMGVLSSDEKETARAIIADPRGAQESYGIGDPVPGNAELAEVFPDHVILLRNQRRETLQLESLTKSGPAKKSRPIKRRLNSTNKKIVGGYQDKLKDDPLALAKELKLAPVRKQGELVGYRVTGRGYVTLMNSLGLRAGDVVKAVNGIPLTSNASGFRVLNELKTTSTANITVMRGTKELTLSIDLPK